MFCILNGVVCLVYIYDPLKNSKAILARELKSPLHPSIYLLIQIFKDRIFSKNSTMANAVNRSA